MNKTKKSSGEANTLAAAVIGAAVGAAAVILSDKNTRDRLKEKGREMLEKGEHKLEEAKDKVDEAKEKSQEKLAKTLNDASTKVKPRRTTVRS